MGQMSAEQTVAIIDSVSNALKPAETVVTNSPSEPTNYWWLLLIALVPAIPQFIKLMNKKGK